MSGSLAEGRPFDQLGLESPFASFAPPSSPFPFEDRAWNGEEEQEEAPQGEDPPKLDAMLAIAGRFDDPKRDRALEMDGTRFADFLKGGSRRSFAADWLKTRPGLARAASARGGELLAGDIAKAWFIIHDVGAGSDGKLKDDRYKASDPKTKSKDAVHGFLNRLGDYAATRDFAKPASGTVFEFLSKRGKRICYGKTINIETVPDIEYFKRRADGSLPPPSNPDLYASIGYGQLGRAKAAADKQKRTHAYYKWTKQAFDVLADLYILASARAGHLLTVTVHKEIDRNLGRSVIWREYDAKTIRTVAKGSWLGKARDTPSNYHGDPYAFDMQALYDLITAKLNALGGRQMPAGARYGVHPLRLRKADGGDIGNGSHHLHEFPRQSDPVVKKDDKLKKAGWWNAGSDGESEAPWSQAEWSEASGHEAEAPWQAAEMEEEQLSPCGLSEQEHEEEFELEEDQMAWLDSESEHGICPNCGGHESWPSEALAEEEGETGYGFEAEDFDGFSDLAGGTELMLAESGPDSEWESEAGAWQASYALVRAIPDSVDHGRYVPHDYRLNAKQIVGKLAVDLEKLKEPGAKDALKFGQQLFKFLGGGNPYKMMINLLVGVLKNIPNAYIKAATAIAEDWAASGYSRGAVIGADGRSKAYLIETFGHDYIPQNPAFPYGRKVAAANYGAGLVAGYLHGAALSKDQRAIFWKDLGRRMGDQSWRGPQANWTDRQWMDGYVEVGANFRRYHL